MGPDFGPSWDQVPNSGPCRSPFKEKRTAALVTWATAAAGFPSSYSRIVLILDLGDRCHGRLGEEQEPEGKTNIKNRYKVLFIDTSLILKSEPRECGSQVSKGAGKLPRILPHLKIEKLTRVSIRSKIWLISKSDWDQVLNTGPYRSPF